MSKNFGPVMGLLIAAGSLACPWVSVRAQDDPAAAAPAPAAPAPAPAAVAPPAPAAAPPAVKYDELPVAPILEQKTGDAVRDKDNAAFIKFLRNVVQQTLSEQPGFGLNQSSKFQYPPSKDKKDPKPREISNTNEKFLTVYFESYHFPMMTKTDATNLGNIANLRVQLQKLARSARGASRTYMIQRVVLPNLDKISKGNYHPAARYNAMLVIGGLNAEEGSSQGNTRRPPRPLDAALPILVGALEDPNSSDATLIAAFLGAMRHAEMDRELRDAQLAGAYAIPEEMRTRIFEAAHKISIEKTVRPNRTPEGHAWIRRRALELCAVTSVPDNRKAIGTVLEIVSNLEEPTPSSLRCTAAVALNRFAYAEGHGVKPLEVAQQLGSLGVYLADSEVKRIAALRKEEERMKLQGPGGAGAGGLMGMGAMGMGAMGGGGAGGGAAPGGMMPGGMSPMGPAGGPSSGAGAMGGGMGAMGGMGGAMGGAAGMLGGITKVVENAYRVDVARRKLKYELNCVLTGVKRMELLATEPEKTQITAIASAVQQLMDVAEVGRKTDDRRPERRSDEDTKAGENDSVVDLARLTKEINRKLASLRSALPKPPVEDPLDADPTAPPPANAAT